MQLLLLVSLFRLVHAATHGTTSRCQPPCGPMGTCNEELGRCDCVIPWTGSTCDTAASSASAMCASYLHLESSCTSKWIANCLNSCNYRGKCIGGVCLCKKGYFGTDCSLSLDDQGKPQLVAGPGQAPYIPRAAGPRIYVYELPNTLTTWWNVWRNDKPLNLLIWQRLLATGVRVADGETADFYFVPVHVRHAAGQIRHNQVMGAVQFARKHYPWWDRYHGGRHLFVAPMDYGRRELSPDVRDITANSTWLTHWGLYKDHSTGWKAAHKPGRDIVLPTLTPPGLVRNTPLAPWAKGSALADIERNATLFFGGSICGNRRPPVNGTCDWKINRMYSAFTRQMVYMHHHNRTGYKLVHSSPQYQLDLAMHKFCLAPTGGGHGRRQVFVALLGCIPVTVTDHVLQPFEPEMPWSDWSVPVRERDIPRMHEVLDAITPQQLKQMQAKLHCAAQHMYYSSTFGSLFGEEGRYDAVETLLQILRVRAANPGLPPGQYMAKDEHFRKFINCELEGEGVAAPGNKDAQLCGWAAPDASKRSCTQCNLRGNAIGWPGGALCCNIRNVTACPRYWA